jgi:hypothetical protein
MKINSCLIMCYTFYLKHKYVVEHCRSIELFSQMVLGIYIYYRQQYFKWVQGWLNPTTSKLLGRHQSQILGLLGA